MPIITVELVDDEEPSPALATELAAAIGPVLGAPDGETWVRLHLLPPARYGESGDADPTIRPAFVTIIAYRKPDDLATVAPALAGAVGAVLDRPPQSVHVIFEPDGAGRVAFGGRPVD